MRAGVGRTQCVVRVFAARRREVRWVSRIDRWHQAPSAGRAGQAAYRGRGRFRPPKSHPTSVAEQLDRWLADIEPTRSAYTVRNTGAASSTTQAGARDVRLDKLTARQLDGFYHDLLARGLSPSSVRRFHSVLHAALDRAVKWGMVPVNPADRPRPRG